MRFDIQYHRDVKTLEFTRSLNAANKEEAAAVIQNEFPDAVILSVSPEGDKSSNPVRAECLAKFNDVVLTPSGEIVRLIGYGEDNSDCYYIAKTLNGSRYGRHFWISAVGGLISLAALNKQGIVRATDGEIWSDYRRLDSLLELNGAPKEAAFFEMRENNFAETMDRAANIAVNRQIKSDPTAAIVEKALIVDALAMVGLDKSYLASVNDLAAAKWRDHLTEVDQIRTIAVASISGA